MARLRSDAPMPAPTDLRRGPIRPLRDPRSPSYPKRSRPFPSPISPARSTRVRRATGGVVGARRQCPAPSKRGSSVRNSMACTRRDSTPHQGAGAPRRCHRPNPAQGFPGDAPAQAGRVEGAADQAGTRWSRIWGNVRLLLTTRTVARLEPEDLAASRSLLRRRDGPDVEPPNAQSRSLPRQSAPDRAGRGVPRSRRGTGPCGYAALRDRDDGRRVARGEARGIVGGRTGGSHGGVLHVRRSRD
jgi:hypothetical protein